MCPGCGEKMTIHGQRCPGCQAVWEEHEQKRLAKRAYNHAYYRKHTATRAEAPGPNRIACCGEWHAITALPLTAPCGHVWFVTTQEAEHAA